MSRGYTPAATDLLPDDVFRKGCRGKVKYGSRKKAKASIRVQRQLGQLIDAEYMGAYKCKGCRRWHIGHSRTRSWGVDDGGTGAATRNLQASNATDHGPVRTERGHERPDQGGGPGPGATALQPGLRATHLPSGRTHHLPEVPGRLHHPGAGATGRAVRRGCRQQTAGALLHRVLRKPGDCSGAPAGDVRLWVWPVQREQSRHLGTIHPG